MEEYIKDYKTCKYCEETYFEYDTGYSDYYCHLLKYNCDYNSLCPFSFKYEIIKEECNDES